MCTHVRRFWGLLLGWSGRANRPNQLRSPATAVSHRFGCTVNGDPQKAAIPQPEAAKSICRSVLLDLGIDEMT
jgi:hypothetical protein